MNDDHVSTAIAHALLNGLQHPGDPAIKQAAVTIKLPMFHTHGRPKAMSDNIESMAKTIAEAITHIIHSKLDSSIIPNDELAQLKSDLTEARQALAAQTEPA